MNSLFLCVCLALSAFVPQLRPSVAIVSDPVTAAAVSAPQEAFAKALEEVDGKRALLIVTPEDVDPQWIRDTLAALWRGENLEGAMLVGDIPVPMIRDAHHLATAFKMDPKMPWDRSSIPSDRFYDDFSLKFEFLKRDEKKPHLYYYSLSPEGAQRVSCDIYTSRVKPAKTDPEHSFTELTAEFFTKAEQAKRAPEALDNVLHFGGHGNSSESFNARIDEDVAFREQFGQDARVNYLNFDEDTYVRTRLMEALSREGLDFAHLHTHGAVGAQYISKEPYTYMTSVHIEDAKKYFRGRMRSAKDKEKTAAQLVASFGIPEAWLEGWDDPATAQKDSVASASVDIILEDLDGYGSAVKVLILDACFNGAFLHDDYIAARYAFGHGSGTLAVFGNTVNIIQDHWKNALAGLLGQGVCVGNWAKGGFTLESHLFGDPTYRFAPSRTAAEKAAAPVKARKKAAAGMALDMDRLAASPDEKAARQLLDSPVPDIRAFAVRYGGLDDESLMELLRSDKSCNVRMMAFDVLVHRGGCLTQTIRTGLEDSYEMIRRMAARYAENNGDPALLESLARHYVDPLETARVRYHLLNALNIYPVEDAAAALEKAREGHRWPLESDWNDFMERFRRVGGGEEADIAAIADPDADLRDRAFTVNAQRNKCNPSAIDPMFKVLADESAPRDLRLKAAEALGWYVWSFRRDEVASRSAALHSGDPEVEAGIRRLQSRICYRSY